MSVFSKPYPKSSGLKRAIISSLLFGLFIFFFLYVFQPFGLNNWLIDNKALRLAGYGLITSFVILFNSLIPPGVLPSFFKEENWTVWKEIVWAFWNILVIGTLNLVYSHLQGTYSITWQGFLAFQLITVLMGLFPVTLITLINYFRLQQRNLEQAKQISQVIEAQPVNESIHASAKLISLLAENGRDEIRLEPEQLIYVESADNYVQLVWMENGQLKKQMIRNTLKNVESSLSQDRFMFRCHRSFLVNLIKVVKVSGNSQGYKLHFAETEDLIPVSRSLNEIIKQRMTEIHKTV